MQLLVDGGSELKELYQRYCGAVHALPVSLKARLCRALHRQAADAGATADRRAPPIAATQLNVLVNVLLATYGAELTSLKNALDAADSATDLLHLISLLSPPLRAHLLSHIRSEAIVALRGWNAERNRVIVSKSSDLSSSSNCDATTAVPPLDSDAVGEGVGWWWPVKLYCDFDDTVQARLFDHSFPSGTVYPGLRGLLAGIRGGIGSWKSPHASIRSASTGLHSDHGEGDLRTCVLGAPSSSPGPTRATDSVLETDGARAACDSTSRGSMGQTVGAPLPLPIREGVDATFGVLAMSVTDGVLCQPTSVDDSHASGLADRGMSTGGGISGDDNSCSTPMWLDFNRAITADAEVVGIQYAAVEPSGNIPEITPILDERPAAFEQAGDDAGSPGESLLVATAPSITDVTSSRDTQSDTASTPPLIIPPIPGSPPAHYFVPGKLTRSANASPALPGGVGVSLTAVVSPERAASPVPAPPPLTNSARERVAPNPSSQAAGSANVVPHGSAPVVVEAGRGRAADGGDAFVAIFEAPGATDVGGMGSAELRAMFASRDDGSGAATVGAPVNVEAGTPPHASARVTVAAAGSSGSVARSSTDKTTDSATNTAGPGAPAPPAPPSMHGYAGRLLRRVFSWSAPTVPTVTADGRPSSASSAPGTLDASSVLERHASAAHLNLGHHPTGDLVLLSARPELLRSWTHSLAVDLGIAPAAILVGTLAAGLSTGRMAARKVSLLNRLSARTIAIKESRRSWSMRSGG